MAAPANPGLTRSEIYLVGVMSGAFFVFGATLVLPGTLLPAIMDKFALRPIWAGVLLSAGSAGYISAVLVAGLIVDRVGYKAVLLIGTALAGTAIGLFGLVDSYPAAVAMLFVFGVGGGGLEIVPNAAIMRLGPVRSVRLLNVAHLFFGLGAFVGPLAVSALIAHAIPWQWVFPMGAGGYILLVALTLPCPFPRRPTDQGGILTGSRTVLASPAALALSLLLAVYVGVEIGIGNWLTKYLVGHHGQSQVTAARVASLYWLALAAGRLIAACLGRIAHPARRISLMAAVGTVVLGVGVGTASPKTAAVCFVLTVLCIGPIYPNAMAWAGELFPHRPGTVAGMIALGGALGAAVFPWIMSAVTDLTDSLQIGMAVYIVLGALVVPCALLVAFTAKPTPSVRRSILP